MQATLSLVRREFSAYFLSPIAYVVLAAFLFVTGLFFNLTLAYLTARGPQGAYFPVQVILTNAWFWLFFWIIPPLLTMRLFAEERGSGTLEMLLTAPVGDWQVVLSKYFACYLFFLVMWLPTLVYVPILTDFDLGTFSAGIDPWPVIASYLGIALAGAMFLALGMFVSSLVRSQLIAFLIALFLSLIFIVSGFLLPEMDTRSPVYQVLSPVYQVLYFFTVPYHFEHNFSRGLVDTRQLVLYVSVTIFFLFLTVRSLESRRWR